MAPSTDSTMTLQQNRLRPAAARRLVPAVPLTFTQKQRQQEAALAKAREQAAVPSEAEVIEAPLLPTPPTSEITPSTVNGSDEREPEAVESSVVPSSPETPATPTTPAVEEEVETEAAAEGTSNHEEIPEPSIDTPRSNPSDSNSSLSRSTYQMPPAFVPANQQPSNGVHQDSIAAPQANMFNGQLPMHHGHPSNGGSMVHGYPASNNSSPAPLSAGGNVPPYPHQQLSQPLQQLNGRHGSQYSNGGHSQHMSNGYAAMGPPPPPVAFYPHPDGSMNSGPGVDNFARRQMASHTPAGGYSPSGTPAGLDGYPPSTPRSMHGSQSSVNNDNENGSVFYGQYPTAVISNGSNGQIEDVRVYQPVRPKSQGGAQLMAASNGFGGPSPQTIDQLDGLVPYIQSTFADPAFADYTLVLCYTDDRAPPMRIPGHGLLFARSPALRALMEELAADRRAEGLTSRDLVLRTSDRFVTSDGVWLTLQRLYGNPLIDHKIFERPDPKGRSADTKASRVELALSYAASGQLLTMPPVVSRGIDLAATLLDFSTIERLLEFALDGGLDTQWMAHEQGDRSYYPSTYGPAVNALIYRCLAFISAGFPTRPASDLSLSEVSHNSRLPSIPGVAGVRSSTHNPRLSQIKFGDHGRDNSGAAALSTISSLLLNLPFHLLKYVLESNMPASTEGWSSPSVRNEFMSIVINEREKRRLKVYSSNFPNRDREANRKDWEVVGWEEKVEVLEPNPNPTLRRSWVGFAPSS